LHGRCLRSCWIFKAIVLLFLSSFVDAMADGHGSALAHQIPMGAKELKAQTPDQLGQLLLGDPLGVRVGILDIKPEVGVLPIVELCGDLQKPSGSRLGWAHCGICDHKGIGAIGKPSIGELVGIESTQVGLGHPALLAPVAWWLAVPLWHVALLWLAVAWIKWSLNWITLRHRNLKSLPHVHSFARTGGCPGEVAWC